MYTAVNARFWQYVNGSPVKLTLRPGQRVQWYTWHEHEEGWASEAHRWSLDPESGLVFDEWQTDGRDCDGRLQRGGASFASFPMLDGILPEEPYRDYHDGRPVRYPEWGEARGTVVFDEYAQAAGY
jgi:hypothetical protein